MVCIESLSQLSKRIKSGSKIGIPPEYSYVPMGLIREIIKQKISNLEVVCVPIGGLGVDMLIGAGCVKIIEAAAVSLGEAGLAPQFTAAVQEGQIVMKDSTCPAIHSGLQASEKGVSFMPLNGIIGSDLLAYRDDWRVINDPFNQNKNKVVLIPAIKPDFAILHSPIGDKFGNVWIGKRRELITLSHAARDTLVTVERITEDNLLNHETLAAGTLSNLYVSSISIVPKGAKPLSLPGYYESEFSAIYEYSKVARTKSGFDKYLKKHMMEYGVKK